MTIHYGELHLLKPSDWRCRACIAEHVHGMCIACVRPWGSAPTPKTSKNSLSTCLHFFKGVLNFSSVLLTCPSKESRFSCYLSPKGPVREAGAFYSMRPLEIYFFSFGDLKTSFLSLCEEKKKTEKIMMVRTWWFYVYFLKTCYKWVIFSLWCVEWEQLERRRPRKWRVAGGRKQRIGLGCSVWLMTCTPVSLGVLTMLKSNRKRERIPTWLVFR